jgi:hypothetical protein
VTITLASIKKDGAQLSIASGKLKAILVDLDRAVRRRVERLLGKGKRKTVSLNVNQLPREVVDALLRRPDLTPRQRETLEKAQPEEETKVLEDWPNQRVKNVGEFSKVLHTVMKKHKREPILELEFAGRWYPINIQLSVRESFFSGKYAEMDATIRLLDVQDNMVWYFGTSDFFDETGKTVSYTVAEILAKRDLRPFDRARLPEAQAKMQKAMQLRRANGRLVLSTNQAIVYNGWWGFAEIPFGTKDQPLKAVLESELEVRDENRDRWERDEENGRTSILPFVRAFSFKHKRYVYLDVEDLEEYKFDDTALERLVIPDTHRETLQTIFRQANNQLFGDLLDNKHGGMIILANGPPGVGKTFTAEVFAEYTHRPLYVMEVGELGTNLANIEQALGLIFARATRWNAVLLFDEADIFMQKRGDDLERSAIVGVFLRLLDYFPGLLFLTTNRRQEIDEAFSSRIAMKIDYEKLSKDSQVAIWEKMFQRAKLTYDGDFNQLVEAHDLNGRVIRNTVRLLRVMCPEGSVSEVKARQAISYSK